ncbi:MAG: bifunctional adenosylcobinamide kinase/adenosylcobinamide-phosphate guanylyltransferase [Oceanospirillaceae bacterium]|nr:bifunctional adenosylcobinamide kinase/adenosylcobinamide-phosphate guanylyltransferase [Oceanospirillaceae bacterium]
MIELFLGGARSGKSNLAEQCASDSGLEVVYIATGTAGDAQMKTRIEQHQQSRPSQWLLVEEPINLAQVIIDNMSTQRCLLVDCLTLWLSNCMFSVDDCYQTQRQQLLDVLEKVPGKIIFVANETSMGVIPMGEITREFCDRAGLLHQALAQKSNKVTLSVAGLPLVLKDHK